MYICPIQKNMTPPLRAVIVEDEEKARKNLTALLTEYCPQVEISGSAGTVAEGVELINNQKPVLLFLDVKMRGETGFDLLEKFDQLDFEIIFTTAHDEFALRAFKFNAVDYLLKPIKIDELVSAVNRAEQRLSLRNRQDENIRALLAAAKNPGPFEKIALPTMEGLVFVKLNEIIRCEASDNYTTFYLTGNQKIMVSKTIKHFEDLLAPHNFFRVHQSHLINLGHIKKYYRGDGGYLVMADGASVMVARRKKETFLKQFMK